MKKNIFLVVIAVFAAFACNAYADEDRLVEIDGKQLAITDVDNVFPSAEQKLDYSELPDGIYIAARTHATGDRLPNAEALIKARFEAAGFKIAEKLEGASVGILFVSNGSLSLWHADQGLAQAAINADKAVGSIGAAAGAVASIGVGAAGVGLLVGALIPQDESAYISGAVSKKPVETKGLWGSYVGMKSSIKKGEFENTLEVQYSLPEEDEKQPTQDIILRVVIDEYIDRYMIKPPAAPIAQAAAANVPASEIKNSVAPATEVKVQ
jgi:hypothetical protein